MTTWKSIDQIRTFVTGHVGKVIEQSKNPIVYEQFRSLFAQHPTWQSRLDSITHIWITRNKLNQAVIVKIKIEPTSAKRNNFITVSWRKCHMKKPRKVRGEEKSEGQQEIKNQLTAAMRYSVRRQISYWRKTHRLNRFCVQCRTPLNLHVDHVVPFSKIQQDFLETWTNPHPTIFGYNRKTCQPRLTRADMKFIKQWNTFHRLQSSFQWLCGSCNSKKGARV